MEILSTGRNAYDELWDEVQRLRAELADEKAAHAKTMDNFEAYVEAQREH